jgi:hypothetical protein
MSYSQINWYLLTILVSKMGNKSLSSHIVLFPFYFQVSMNSYIIKNNHNFLLYLKNTFYDFHFPITGDNINILF